MAMPTQLDRIEAFLVKIELEQRQAIGLLSSLVAEAQIMSLSLSELAAKIDTAANAIAAKLTDESTAIGGVATVVTSLRDQLAALGVTQAVLDQLSSAADRLTTAAVSIDAQAAQLQTIAADPANPVPATSA